MNMLKKTNIDLSEFGLKKSDMPHGIIPMVSETAKHAFNNPEWIFEIKWDGYRAIAEISRNGKVNLYSRNLISFNQSYPSIVSDLSRFKIDAIIDGEIVALDGYGKPSFGLLQDFKKNKANIVYYVFDIIYLNGYSLLRVPLIVRKNILKNILPEGNNLRFSNHIDGYGLEFFNLVKDEDLEGIIAKEKNSLYFPGQRSNKWLKIKNIFEEEVIICGYTPPNSGRNYFSSLILGSYKNGDLVYRGKVGTGFDEITLKSLYLKFRPLVQIKSPFKNPPKFKAVWLEPDLVCQIKYTEITKEGFFRQPVFLGLRIDKKPSEVKFA